MFRTLEKEEPMLVWRSCDLPVLILPGLSVICCSGAFCIGRLLLHQILSEWLRKPSTEEAIKLQERILLKRRRKGFCHIWSKEAWCDILQQEREILLRENVFDILFVS